ncbi:MAG TPA: ABC transporter permease, partial [Dongiaceae bacterium]
MRTRDIPALLYVIAAVIFIFLPVVILVQFSFQDGLAPVPPFKGFSLRWYDRMFADRKLMEALGNSVIVGGLSSLAATALGFLAAFKLARRPGRAAPQIRFLLMAPITVSYIIIALGLLIVFNGLGIGKSLFAVGIGHVVINLPLCFAVIYSQMGEHQANVERAALDLGAS